MFNADCQNTVKVSKPCSPKVKKGRGEQKKWQTWMQPVSFVLRTAIFMNVCQYSFHSALKWFQKASFYILISIIFSENNTDSELNWISDFSLACSLAPSGDTVSMYILPEHTHTFHLKHTFKWTFLAVFQLKCRLMPTSQSNHTQIRNLSSKKWCLFCFVF